ncbi:DUF4043 family protein, partial [Vibrio cholerae O1]|nr:DUF4043 family protein [Vibrio cholerae O1]
VQRFKVNAGEVDLSTADIMKMDKVDAVRSFLDQMVLPPPPVECDGDEMAKDSPFRVLLVSASQYEKCSTDPNFRQY